jgi:hypothetical protein
MPSSIITQLTLIDYQALVAGIPKYCPSAIFTVAGQTFTATEAVTFITSVLNTVSATATAKTGWKDARLAEEKMVADNGAVVKGIRDNVALMFSNNTTTLAAFSITPKKPRAPLSVEARAAATAKATATRLARGTTSKKQKGEISGNVTGVTITPVTAPVTIPAAQAPVGSAIGATSTASATPSISIPVVPVTSSGLSPVAIVAPHA